jgi:hypothetical protein
MDPRLAFARQFGNPSGVLGGIAGRAMAKGNAAFNTWLVGALAEQVPPAGVGRLLELGHGPGVRLGVLLDGVLDATARRLSLAVTSHSEVWPDGTIVTWRLAGTLEAFGSGFLPFFISWDDPGAISSQLDRVKTHAQGSCDPLDFAWIELGGANDRLSEWIGPLETPVRCIDREPGLRGVGLRSTTGEVDLRP